MSTLIHSNGQLEKLFEFSHIVENIRDSKRSVQRSFGQAGLRLYLPVNLGVSTLRVLVQKNSIRKFYDQVLTSMEQMSSRQKMRLERDLVNSSTELEKKLLPLINRIEKQDILLAETFAKEVVETLSLIKSKTEAITKIVYPNRVDPASDPELFKELVEAYKGFDLTDWKSEFSTKKEHAPC